MPLKRSKKCEPKLKIWKLKEDKYKRLFAKKLNLKNTDGHHRFGTGVNEKWQDMIDILVSTAEEVCGTRRNPPGHTETWWENTKLLARNLLMRSILV